MKHVWVINHYSSLRSKDGSSGRHEKLAIAMKQHGWSTTLITASTSHPDGKQHVHGRQRRQVSTDNGVDYVMLRTPTYSTNGLRRTLNMFVFMLNALSPGALRGAQAPDVILGSTVHLLAAWAASRLARRWRVPFVFEIRDVWPDTLIDLGKLGQSSLAARIMRNISISLCKHAVLVVAPLPGVRSYLDENGFEYKSFAWVSNGVTRADDEDTIPPTAEDGSFTFMYLGAHGNANALEDLLEAFDEAQRRSSAPLRLRLVGDGPLKPRLLAMADALNSRSSIEFETPIPRTEVVGRAREADCLVATMGDHAVYRFGISLNKIFDYMQSGRPILFASSAINNPVSDAGAGITTPAGNVPALVEAMLRMVSTDSEARMAMGRRGKVHVNEHYTYAVLAERLSAELDPLLMQNDVAGEIG